MSVAFNIIQSRSGGKVERCHKIPHAGSYNVAAHSWGVAMLMYYIWPQDFERLAIHCLAHDIPESWVGDIPSSTIRYTPGLKDTIAKIEYRILKNLNLPFAFEPEDLEKIAACDSLEFWLWAKEQVLMGNKFAQDSIKEVERFFKETPLPSPANEVFESLQNMELLPVQAGVIKELNACQ